MFVLTKNKKEKKDILGLGPKTKGKWGKKKNEGRRKASGKCRVMIYSPSPEELGYEPNEPNTINL